MKLPQPITVLPGLVITRLHYDRYKDENLAVLVVYEDGEHEAISVNIPEQAFVLSDNEFFLKNWGAHESIAKALIDAGLIELTGSSVQTGFVQAPVAKLVAKDMDPIPYTALGDEGSEYNDGEGEDLFED